MTLALLVVIAALGNPAEQAEALNEEGKMLYKDKSYPAAVEKFRAAIELVPDARFYFNLCASLEKVGDLDGALQACDAVYAHAPSDALKGKTGERAAEIRKRKDELAATSPTEPTGTPTTSPAATPTGPAPSGGAMPAPAEAEVEKSPGDYRFALGADLGIARNRSIGNDELAKSGGLLKLHADFYILPTARLGIRASLDFTTFSGGEQTGLRKTLQVTDFGGGMFWHARITDNFWVTPLAGVMFSILQPDAELYNADPYVTFGFRVEAALQYLFGGGHHVIAFTPLVNAYLPASNDNAVRLPSEWGLDTGGVSFAFCLGYAYRFTEALPAFVTLE
jgi:tetratricopeptide (TPR) repeat protein